MCSPKKIVQLSSASSSSLTWFIMRNIILFLLIVASCNALVLQRNDKNENTEVNGEILTYIRGVKEGFQNRTQPVVVDRISKIFKEVFRPTEPPRELTFFERIMNFFRNINIFGLRFNRPPPDDELQCIDINDFRCNEIFTNSRNPSNNRPLFVNTRINRNDDDPLFFAEQIQAEDDTKKNNIVKKEVKLEKYYVDPELESKE